MQPRKPLALSLRFWEFLFPACFYWSLVFLVWDKQRYDIVHSNPLFSWVSSEWLISYQGGFVRRGLFGGIFHFLIDHGIDKNLVLTAFPSICFFSLVFLWFGFGLRAYLLEPSVKTAALFCFLINPSALFFFLTNGNIFRKDIVFIALLYFSICLISFLLQSCRRRAGSALVCVSLLFFGLCMLGLHVGLFVFIALPLFAALFFCPRDSSLFGTSRAHRVIAVLAIAFLLSGSVASVIFNGDQSNVFAICQSWSAVWEVSCTSENLPNLGAVASLGWSKTQAWSVSGLRNLFSLFSPLNLLSIALFPALTSRLVCALAGGTAYLAFRNTLAYLFWPCCVLFVIGCDWGRFMGIVLTSACLIALSVPSVVPGLATMPRPTWGLLSLSSHAVDRICLPLSVESPRPSRFDNWLFVVSLFAGLPLIGYTSLDQIFTAGVRSTFADRATWILQVFFNQSIAR